MRNHPVLSLAEPGDSDFWGLYIHVPFCKKKCDYCGFYSEPPDSVLVDEYIKKIEQNLKSELFSRNSRKIRSVFMGGGNPTSIGNERFQRLLKAVLAAIEKSPIEEFSLETNPETLNPSIIKSLSGLPKLRINVGVQRLEDAELVLIGRDSTVKNCFEALKLAFLATQNVGIDLILGISNAPFRISGLNNILEHFPLSHISTYFLTVEEGTRLAWKISEGTFPDPAEADPDELFKVAELLSEKGFEHYEISNFSKKGKACLHNLNYWLGGNYLGFGPSAVGTIGKERIQQVFPVREWLTGTPPCIERLSERTKREEFIMLRLRLLKEGLELRILEERFGKSDPKFLKMVENQIAQGYLIESAGKLFLSKKGIIFSNRVISNLF